MINIKRITLNDGVEIPAEGLIPPILCVRGVDYLPVALLHPLADFNKILAYTNKIRNIK